MSDRANPQGQDESTVTDKNPQQRDGETNTSDGGRSNSTGERVDGNPAASSDNAAG